MALMQLIKYLELFDNDLRKTIGDLYGVDAV